MKKKINVSFFQRKPISGYYSVERIFRDLRIGLEGSINSKICIAPFVSKGLFRRLCNAVVLSFKQSEVNHIAGDITYISLLLRSRRTVLTVLDCVMMERLSGIKKFVFRMLWLKIPSILCKKITVISDFTKRQLIEHARIDPAKIVVIYINISPDYIKSQKEFRVNSPNILMIGTAWNKNTARALRALADIDCTAMIVGKLTEEMLSIIREYNINYINYIDITDDAVKKLYIDCDMLLFPSLYEGFGMPIVEANAIGRPVITSNLASMPEIASDAAVLVDPYSVPSIAEGVKRIIEDPQLRNELVINGYQNARRFSIANISMQYYAVYDEILSR